MEQVYVTAKAAFVNQRVGTVNRGQRMPMPRQTAEELAAMGLVAIEKQLPALLKTAEPVPQGAGQAAPSSVLPAGQASETTNSPRRKRGRPSKVGDP